MIQEPVTVTPARLLDLVVGKTLAEKISSVTHVPDIQ